MDEIADQLTPNDVVVVIFSDHGSKYVSKVFNDEWMMEQGFLEPENEAILAEKG